MDPFRLCLALGPVAIYLLLLGAIHLSRRPLLVSGPRDAAALALAVSGLVIVGPVELFFPFQAAAKFGGYVWPLLLALYGLCVALVLLLMRPRLVIYNISADSLRPIMGELVERLDPAARWAGDSLAMPDLGVHLYVDSLPSLRCVSLISAGGNQSHQGWRRLEAALSDGLAREASGRSPSGLLFGSSGLVIATMIVAAIAGNPQAVAESLAEIARALLKMTGL